MAREIETGGIPTTLITSLPDIAEDNGVLRIVRGYGMPWPTGNPYLFPVQEQALRRAVIEQALYTLTLTPAKPTHFWTNYGNVMGNQETVDSPVNVQTKDWITL
jgi:hypothetical protein